MKIFFRFLTPMWMQLTSFIRCQANIKRDAIIGKYKRNVRELNLVDLSKKFEYILGPFRSNYKGLSIFSNYLKIRQIKFSFVKYLLLFLLSFGIKGAFAATINITSNTNWNAITTGTGPGGQPSSADDIVVSSNVVLTVNVPSGVCKSITLGQLGPNNNGDLTFNASSQITVSGVVLMADHGNRTNTITMTLGGKLICQGLSLGTSGTNSFTPGSGTIELSATNTLPSSVFTTFNNLTINGGATTTGVSITVTGTLTLTNGILTTTSTNLLTVTNTATTAISGGSTTAFINGPVRWSIGTSTYIFPVGNGSGNYLPFKLATTASASATAR